MSNDTDFDRIMSGLRDVKEFLDGRADPSTYVVHVPREIDTRRIRVKLKMTQAQFAARYGFSVGAVRDWEQGRRHPEASARVLLKLIDRRPEVVDQVLSAA